MPKRVYKCNIYKYMKFNIYFQISPHTHIFIAKCFVTLYVNQPITYYEKTIITTFCVRGSGG